MECGPDCGCGSACQNQRFLRKTYADVTVIKTEKKGYGLRANTDLLPNAFIFEYLGEVVGEAAFRKRMVQYDEEGIKHFYFMSLTKGEFVDATRKGNLGRFCNHSCNPNCYVDKWVVGDKLRMGIFAERKIQAGEELVFNYNVDRYGADPQPCYCAEPNCTGFIGGKTQTESGTKLSNTLIEALGIEDADAWDMATAKRPRKKKRDDDDEEYVNNVEPRGLEEEGVNKVMSSLMQCKEKWIAVKLLARIQRVDDERVRNRVVRFHGYRILKTVLSTFMEDVNVCLQILDVLDKMPRLTRNKIQDSKIDETVQELVCNSDERVALKALGIIEAWGKLEIGYRIPRMKRDPNTTATDRKQDRFDRRGDERRRSRSRTRSPSPDRSYAPTGPRGNANARGGTFFSGSRPRPRFRPPPPAGALPPGWFEAATINGSTYYYNQAGVTMWQRPTGLSGGPPPPPPPSRAVTNQQMLQDLIQNIVSAKKEPSKPAAETPTSETPRKEGKQEKWRSLSAEKQKKLYEGALQPHIMHVVGKYKHKLPKDDLKRWAKEFAKKVVESDFKKDRVQDPSQVGDKQAKSVKKHAHEFFEKAVKKRAAAERKRGGKTKEHESHTPGGSPRNGVESPKDELEGNLSDDYEAEVTRVGSSASPGTLKRRRAETVTGDVASPKRLRTDSGDFVPPPPPPPPPPAMDAMDEVMDKHHETPAACDADMVPAAVVSPRKAHGHAPARAEAMTNGRHPSDRHPSGRRPSGLAQRSSDLSQTATPPTTGPPDPDEAEKRAKRQNFAGMNPERMRQLGLLDGANN